MPSLTNSHQLSSTGLSWLLCSISCPVKDWIKMKNAQNKRQIVSSGKRDLHLTQKVRFKGILN